jgi:hypothetical protein
MYKVLPLLLMGNTIVSDQTFHYLYGLEADQVLAQDSETGIVWSLADRFDRCAD